MPTRTPPSPDRGDFDSDKDAEDEERERTPEPHDVAELQTAPLPPLPMARAPSQQPPAPPDGVDISEAQTGLLTASPSARDTLREEMIAQHQAASAKARQRAATSQQVIDAQAARIRLVATHLDALRRIPDYQRTATEQHQIATLAADLAEMKIDTRYIGRAQANHLAEAERHEAAADELRRQMETPEHRPPPWRAQRRPSHPPDGDQ